MERNDFMDQLAKNALDGYEANYSPAEWDRMEGMLDRKGRLMPRLWAFKGAEILGLLLLLGGLQWFVFGVPGQTAQDGFTPTVSENTYGPQSPQESNDSPSAVLTAAKTARIGTSTETVRSNSGFETLPSENGHVNKAPAVLPKDIPALRKKEATSRPSNKSFPYLDTAPSITPPQPAVKPDHPLADNTQNVEGSTERGEPLDLFALFMKSSNLSSQESLTTFEKLALKASPPKKAEKRPAKTEWLLGTSFSPEFTHLVNAGAASVGLGAEVNATLMVSDKIGFETGLQYSLKRYFSKENRNTQTQNGSTLYTQEYQKVNMHTITVPLKVRMNVYQNRNMRLYATAGGSISGIVSNDVTTEYSAKSVDPLGSELNVAGSLNRNLPQDKGLLQGGSTSNNLFGSLNGAVGAEFKAVGKSWLYIQPYYTHSLNEAGPHNERFGTYGLAIGARF